MSVSVLASLPEFQRKQVIGERLFAKLEPHYHDRAGKITGMLLEMDNSELLHLFDDESALRDKANEADAILSKN